MAHELTIRTNGKAEMAYVGETPWHGLGQSLGRGRTIEEWQQAAGMDWKIARSRVRYGDAANTRIIEDKHVLFRSDTKDALGIVSDKFQIVQPRAVLEFFRDLTAGNGFELETAGTLYGGRRFWAMASIGKAAQIAGVDRVGGYLLLSTGADGTLATSARFTTVRVVCNNTLTMALRKDGRNNTGVASVNHRSGFDADAVKNQLGITRSNMHGIFGEFEEVAQTLAAKRVDQALAVDLTLSLLGADGKPVETVKKIAEGTGFKKIISLFSGAGRGAQLTSANGTAWGWLNAVTEFVDHVGTARTDSARLDSAWFGKGDALKTKAAELALAA
jgi:phage/plasmid-like protein (TIGR03299 family)